MHVEKIIVSTLSRTVMLVEDRYSDSKLHLIFARYKFTTLHYINNKNINNSKNSTKSNFKLMRTNEDY